jgi:hypothetical protein
LLHTRTLGLPRRLHEFQVCTQGLHEGVPAMFYCK